MRKTFLILLILMMSRLTALAGSDYIVVEVRSSMRAAAVASAAGATVVDSIPGTPYYLVKIPSASALRGNPAVISTELNDAVSLRPAGGLGILKMGGAPAPQWYTGQPAMKLIRADKAQAMATGRGIVIADLNSRIDYGHPALRGHLTGGFDFVAERAARGAILNQSSASFLDQSSAAFLDQSSAAFLDQSSAAFLDQSTAAFLDQSTASFLDQSSASFLDAMNPAHGHGTFVAGLIAVVAPDAMIMPLRVFDDAGYADGFVIARAIHYAVQNGADVINMSFGMVSDMKVVKQAVAFAVQRGVTVVASAGNASTDVPQYPAAFNDVIGVAATDLTDRKADFSNYGRAVYVDAPGVSMISAYPGGYYAVASGTSFSAPLVAGEAALLKSAARFRNSSPEKAIARGAINIDSRNPDYARQLGFGRIDMVRALEKMN